jgi:hypothetical protein
MTPHRLGTALVIIGFLDLLAVTIWVGGFTPKRDEPWNLRRAGSIPNSVLAGGLLACLGGVILLAASR